MPLALPDDMHSVIHPPEIPEGQVLTLILENDKTVGIIMVRISTTCSYRLRCRPCETNTAKATGGN